MTHYAVYVEATGELVSTGTVVADPLPAGLAAVLVGEGDMRPPGVWDAVQRRFVAAVPPEPPPLSTLDFARRFTVQEEARIRAEAKSDALIEVFLSRLALAEAVRLEHPDTVQGVRYLQSLGILTADRAEDILHG